MFLTGVSSLLLEEIETTLKFGFMSRIFSINGFDLFF